MSSSSTADAETTTTTTSNSNKKLKRMDSNSNRKSSNNDNDVVDVDDEFQIVRMYLSQCPHVPQSSPAIRAALDGIDREVQRRIRDAKLQRKFGGTTGVAAAGLSNDGKVKGSNGTDSLLLSDSDVVVVDTTSVMSPGGNSASNWTGVSTPLGMSLSRDAVDNDDEIMEWQDVQDQSTREDDVDVDEGHDGSSGPSSRTTIPPGGGTEMDKSSFLGKQLARLCIDAIAVNQVKVRSPTAAIAVALHAALRSTVLGFACTGVPEDESASKTKGGFAPPVRELSPNQFLPLDWDIRTDKVFLRYRKNGTGALVLKVVLSSSAGETGTIDTSTGDVMMVHIDLVPASSKEPPSQTIVFPLTDHINLDSWNAALKAGGAAVSNSNNVRIAPSLHYKALSSLLTKFCQTFDLGVVGDATSLSKAGGDPTAEIPYVDNTIITATNNTASSSSTRTNAASTNNNTPSAQHRPNFGSTDDPLRIGGVYPYPSPRQGGIPEVAWNPSRVPTTLDQAFPNPRGPYGAGGDFAGDLRPAGLPDLRLPFEGGDGRMGGNLMGPNHPLFGAGGGSGFGGGGIPIGGPGTMQPRYDPIYPPGVDDGRNDPLRIPNKKNDKTKPAPIIPGEPNPDHLPPPNSFGNGDSDNMFS